MNEFAPIAELMPDTFRILWRENVSSTNDDLRALALKGTPEGLVLVCEEQAAGRGRRGAAWFSPKGESLAFSVLLRPIAPKSMWCRLSLAAGLAVAEALEKVIPLVEIKWPNDVLVSGRKIAGILVEAGADFVIVGIGINVNSEHFPEGLGATSLKVETGLEVSRAEVLLEVVKRLDRHAGRIDKDFPEILESVRERCALTGKSIALTYAERRVEGFVRGIGSAGELLVEISGKLETIFQADEIRVIGD